MKIKEKKRKINIKNSQFIVINSILNSKKENNSNDLLFNESNYYLNNDKILPKYNNTISYTNSESNKKSDKPKKTRILSNFNAKEVISSDKIIQTPPYFYSIDTIHKKRNKYIIPNDKHIDDLNKSKLNHREKIIQRMKSDLRHFHFSKTFYNKYGKIKNIKYSRNKIFPILKNNKQKTYAYENSSKNFNIFQEYFTNSGNGIKKKHHNLLTIENIYYQRKYDNNNNDNTKNNYKYYYDYNYNNPRKKKITIIKYIYLKKNIQLKK